MDRSRIIAVSLTLVCVVALLAPAVQAAKKGQTVTISRELEFTDAAGAPQKVIDECQLQTRLPEFIRDFAKGTNVVLADKVDKDAEGLVLHIVINNVVGPSGGAWSGAKFVGVEGELTENGEVIGTFIASRYSGGGAFGGYKGTCSILGRCVKALGKDIATWLAKPSMNARLGDS